MERILKAVLSALTVVVEEIFGDRSETSETKKDQE